MTHWADPKRRTELRHALVRAAGKALVAAFHRSGAAKQPELAILADALEELEPGEWGVRSYDGALRVAVNRAAEALPNDEGPKPEYSRLSWWEVGRTLFGFENAEAAGEGKKRTDYARQRQAVVDRSVQGWSRATYNREIFKPFYNLLADAFASLKPEITDEPTPAVASEDDDPADLAEVVAEIKEYWASPTAYNDFDLDTIEGVRNMYRQLMEDAARAICLYDVPVAAVVAILRSNKARPDLSGHDIDEMTEQVAWSADRMQQILDHETGAVALYGRVIDEQGNVVEGVQQVAGSSIRLDKRGEVVGDGPNLISDSEIDAWMRGVLEHAEPAHIAAGTLDAIRVLAHYVRVRLERSVAWQQEAEQAAASQPNDIAAQQQLLLTERETKRQLAAVDALRQAMQQTSPAKVRCFAESVLWHDLSMGAAGNMNVEELIERFRDDKEFRQYRHGGGAK